MDREEMLGRIYDHFEWRRDAHDADATFLDMELDSLGLAEVLMLVEDGYSIRLPGDVLDQVTRLTDLLDLADAGLRFRDL